MNCSQIAARLEERHPEYEPLEVSRFCTLLANSVDDTQLLEDPKYFDEIWEEVNLRLNAALDQHGAMSEELNDLSNSDPQKFSPEQIWILVRAIKVQSQVLRLYVGDPEFTLM